MQFKNFNYLGLIATFLMMVMMEPVLALQPPEKVLTFGDIADKLIVGTGFITRIVLIACVTIGVILIISAFLYFRAHLQNPKFSPLDRPFFLLFFGLILIAVPFLGDIFGPTGSVFEIKKTEEVSRTKMAAPIDIDAPLEFGNEYDH